MVLMKTFFKPYGAGLFRFDAVESEVGCSSYKVTMHVCRATVTA